MPRSMPLPVIPVARLACTFVCALLMFHTPSVDASPSPAGPKATHVAQDSDGDGIGDSLDPDDDNDGIVDSDEGNPPPAAGSDGGNDSSPPDADGDGIGDVLDPDDNNNGVTDIEEPAGPPSQPSVPSSPSGGTGDDPTSQDSSDGLVLALPVTGSGPTAGSSVTTVASQYVLMTLAAACWLGANRIRHRASRLEGCAT